VNDATIVSEEGVEQRAAPLLDAQLNHPAGGGSVAAVCGEARQLTRPWCSFESAVDRDRIIRPTSYTGRTTGWKLRNALHVKLEPMVPLRLPRSCFGRWSRIAHSTPVLRVLLLPVLGETSVGVCYPVVTGRGGDGAACERGLLLTGVYPALVVPHDLQKCPPSHSENRTFRGVSVGHRKGLRENVVCRSSSPIHILYNHAVSGGPRSLCGGRAALAIFN